MKRIVVVSAMSLCVVLAADSSADTLVMRDGSRIEGTLVSFATRTITFRHADGASRRYRTSQVEAVEFVSAERASPRAINSLDLEAPAGSELAVRTVETIDSRNVGADQVFSAIVAQDVRNAAGEVIVPEGSSAQLLIRQMSAGGATGSAELALDVQSITVAGRKYLVTTADLTPGSGTGIGTHSLAAATPAGDIAADRREEVLTRGRYVRIPAETVLTLRLDRPVKLLVER